MSPERPRGPLPKGQDGGASLYGRRLDRAGPVLFPGRTGFQGGAQGKKKKGHGVSGSALDVPVRVI
jgi:hypothetical protein